MTKTKPTSGRRSVNSKLKRAREKQTQDKPLNRAGKSGKPAGGIKTQIRGIRKAIQEAATGRVDS